MYTPAVAFLLSIGISQAATVWNPAANTPPVVPPATGDWSDPDNWTAGLPVSVAPGETTASLNVTNAAECRITDSQSIGQLNMNVNGAGSVLRIMDGGSLTTGANWTAVGYGNANNHLIVEAGGSATFGNHLWVGFFPGAVGTVDIDGGTVDVSGQLGLGWDGGTGFVNVRNDGVLNLSSFDSSRAISGTSVLDIESGTVLINGNKSTAVHDYIAANRITGYSGSGTAIYDYNVSNPGKTTVRAVVGQIVPNWHVAATVFPTDASVIIPFDSAVDFGIIADGVTDVTDEIQSALIVIGNIGGGTLFLPAGHYKINGNLTIPSGVTLRGDWQKPIAGQAIGGTILKAYAGRGDENAAPFIELSNSAGVTGVSIWYPEQLANNIQPYPPTIHGGGTTVENVTFVNAYFGFTSYVEGTTARPFLRKVYGTPLKTGIEFDCLADIGRIESVHFSPDFWAGSGLAGAPTANEHESWIYQNGTGVIVRRIDWSYSCYVTVEGYSIGLALRPGRYDGKYPNGQSYDFSLIGCKTGVHIEASAYAGYQFTRFDIHGAETGVYMDATAIENNMFHTCSIEASDAAILNQGGAKVQMISCDIQQGAVRMDGGYLSVSNSDFSAGTPVHIELGGGVAGATILGNRFPGGARIVDRTYYPVYIDHTALSVDALPAYNYKKSTLTYQPATSDIFVVTETPFNAAADGVADDTAAFQAALAAADANGGGTVFVPGGTYRLNGTLTIPTDVELRGIFETPNDTKVKGSLLNVYSGRNNANGTPFIQLESGAGVRGLSFHYPEQIYDEVDTVNYGMVPYPFLLRGLGSDVYVINLSATIPYQLLDLATHRCDRHYVDYIFSTALKTGFHVGNGAVDGQIQNCQLNPSAYTHAGAYYDSIPFGTAGGIHEIQWRDTTPYLFGHMTGEVLHENFVFGGALGFHLVEEGGSGPSGHCLGMGIDQCTTAMQIDDVGSGGLEPINSQIVTVNGTDGRYLETGAGLQDTFRMFSSAGWGTHEFSAAINGGDVKLQLFHLARDGESGAFLVQNDATLESLGGSLRDFLSNGRPFLTIDSTATANFTGNILNTTSGQMPSNTSNVTAIANLRVGDTASGADIVWTNGAGNRLWASGSNWSAGEPGTNDGAVIANNPGDGPLIDSGTNALVGTLAVGDGVSSADDIEMTGGALNTTEWLVLGNSAGTNGSFTISDGTVGVGSDLFVGLSGTGSIDMTGGSMTVGGMLGIASNGGSSGAISLSGGTINAGLIHMTSGASLDLSGGALILVGDATATITTYINNGWITAHGGAGTLALDFDATNSGKTTLTGSQPPLSSTVWDPDVTGLWTGSVNWTGGAAPIDQSQNLKVVFNKDGVIPCILDVSATVGLLVMGDNQTVNGNFLTLEAGANLTCGISSYGMTQWTGIGYNRAATMTVETGAQMESMSHLWIGLADPAVGTLNINGGGVSVAGTLGLGWDSGAGRVNIRNGGTLNVAQFDSARSISGASVIDIESGSMILSGDHVQAVDDYVVAGGITAYGGSGSVSVAYDLGSNTTTVSATAPLSGFESWALGWGEDIGPPENDHDNDTRENFYEYAFNGDPTDSSNRGVSPHVSRVEGGLAFRHLIRKDDGEITYTVESSISLAPNSWLDAGLSVLETSVYDDDYDEVTYSVPTDEDVLFLRVRANYP